MSRAAAKVFAVLTALTVGTACGVTPVHAAQPNSKAKPKLRLIEQKPMFDTSVLPKSPFKLELKHTSIVYPAELKLRNGAKLVHLQGNNASVLLQGKADTSVAATPIQTVQRGVTARFGLDLQALIPKIAPDLSRQLSAQIDKANKDLAARIEATPNGLPTPQTPRLAAITPSKAPVAPDLTGEADKARKAAAPSLPTPQTSIATPDIPIPSINDPLTPETPKGSKKNPNPNENGGIFPDFGNMLGDLGKMLPGAGNSPRGAGNMQPGAGNMPPAAGNTPPAVGNSPKPQDKPKTRTAPPTYNTVAATPSFPDLSALAKFFTPPADKAVDAKVAAPAVDAKLATPTVNAKLAVPKAAAKLSIPKVDAALAIPKTSAALRGADLDAQLAAATTNAKLLAAKREPDLTALQAKAKLMPATMPSITKDANGEIISPQLPILWDAWHKRFAKLAGDALLVAINKVDAPLGANTVEVTITVDSHLSVKLQRASNPKFDQAVLQAYRSLDRNQALTFPSGSLRSSISFAVDNKHAQKGIAAVVNSRTLTGDKEEIRARR